MNAQPDPGEQQLQALLGGELPGAGIYFPQGAGPSQILIPTDPEQVRDWLLRAIQSAAESASMPYAAVSPDQAAAAALRFAQAYLLLDPSVDENGVPIEAKTAGALVESHGKAAAQAHFQPPPHVGPGPAAGRVAAKNKPKTQILRAARGSKPTPQPRA